MTPAARGGQDSSPESATVRLVPLTQLKDTLVKGEWTNKDREGIMAEGDTIHNNPSAPSISVLVCSGEFSYSRLYVQWEG
jgi:hypothetical protein